MTVKNTTGMGRIPFLTMFSSTMYINNSLGKNGDMLTLERSLAQILLSPILGKLRLERKHPQPAETWKGRKTRAIH